MKNQLVITSLDILRNRLLVLITLANIFSVNAAIAASKIASDMSPPVKEVTKTSAPSTTVPSIKKTQNKSSAIQCTSNKESAKGSAAPVRLIYKLHQLYPHRTTAFSQGLIYHEGDIYESTGQYGQSSVSQLDLKTAAVKQSYALDKKFFGEGLTLWQDQLIQLSWKSGKVFRYALKDLTLVETQTISGEGWGITQNGESLITSNGSSTLSFRNPKTLAIEKTLAVNVGGRPLKQLNELEWVNGCILANIWQSQFIAVINPQNGETISLIDLSPIILHEQKAGTKGVANGVALIPESQHLLITGKNWRGVYELEILQ
jgi:glutamine cyclotransferase